LEIFDYSPGIQATMVLLHGRTRLHHHSWTHRV